MRLNRLMVYRRRKRKRVRKIMGMKRRGKKMMN
jgi:hypothetical protein